MKTIAELLLIAVIMVGLGALVGWALDQQTITNQHHVERLLRARGE